jgi:transposase
MLSLPPSVRILLAREPADMRKGFDGLSHFVQSVLQEDPLSGHLFIFRNRRGDRVKLLLWDSDGYLILYKRLEKGTFGFPAPSEAEATSVTVNATDLIMLLDGVDLQSVSGDRGTSASPRDLRNYRRRSLVKSVLVHRISS